MKGPVHLLGGLSTPVLEALATAVEAGWISGTSPRSVLTQSVGDAAGDLGGWLRQLETAGFKPTQTALLLRSVISGRQHERGLVPGLVVSGPDVPGVPTADTFAVAQELFQRAEEEVVVAGYAFFNGRLLFERLAERRRVRPGLRLLFHVDVPRRPGDTTSAEAIIQRFADDFRKRHWPWEPLPEVFFDPRALSADPQTRASLHAKVVVVDRRELLLTSANFTEAAHGKNIEMGILSQATYLAEQVAAYFEGLRQTGQLQRLPDDRKA